jgi:hypothetical protein
LALPLTAVLTWYCYDYLTPSDLNLGINVGPDWTPYQHGISSSRYIGALKFQAPVTLFGFLYLDAGIRGVSRKTVIIATLAIAIAAGVIRGHFLAQRQYQFLSLERSPRGVFLAGRGSRQGNVKGKHLLVTASLVI